MGQWMAPALALAFISKIEKRCFIAELYFTAATFMTASTCSSPVSKKFRTVQRTSGQHTIHKGDTSERQATVSQREPPPLKGRFYETRVYHKRKTVKMPYLTFSLLLPSKQSRMPLGACSKLQGQFPPPFKTNLTRWIQYFRFLVPADTIQDLSQCPKRWQDSISLSNVCSVGLSSWEKQGVPCV